MYHKLKYLSICLISCFAVLVTSILQPAAATATVSFNFSPSTVRAYPIYEDPLDPEIQTNGSTEILGQQGSVVYEAQIPLYVQLSNNTGYLCGNYYQQWTFTATAPTDGVLQAYDIYYQDTSPEYTYSGMTQRGTSYLSHTCGVRWYADNFWCPFSSSGSLQVGYFTVHVTCYYNPSVSYSSRPPYLEIAITSSGNAYNSMFLYDQPDSRGLEGVIAQAIVDALNTPNPQSGNNFTPYEFLTDYVLYLYQLDQTSTDILSKLNTVLTHVSQMNVTWLPDIDILLNNIYTRLGDILNYDQSIFVKIRDSLDPHLAAIESGIYELIHQNESDTEPASALDQAAQQLEAIESGIAVPTLSNQEVFGSMDADALDYANESATPYFWTNHSRITSILVMVFTVMIVGFVIYGKSG